MALTQEKVAFINRMANLLAAQESTLVTEMVIDAEWSAQFQSAGADPITDGDIQELQRYADIGLTQADLQEMAYIIGNHANDTRARLTRYARVRSLT